MINTTRLAEWSEIIGGIVIVVSLFYVGFQVKQNTDAIEAETLNNVTSDLSDIFAMPMDLGIAKLVVKARSDPDSFSSVDAERFFGFWAKHVATYEPAWLHKESGLLSDAYWNTLIGHQCDIFGLKPSLILWFEWKGSITLGYWEEITTHCKFVAPE